MKDKDGKPLQVGDVVTVIARVVGSVSGDRMYRTHLVLVPDGQSYWQSTVLLPDDFVTKAEGAK